MEFETVAVAIAIILFAILTFFVVRTLITLQTSLKRMNHTLMEVERKAHYIDPLLRSLSNLGEISEQKTFQLKKQLLHESSKEEVNTSELGDWIVLSTVLLKKFISRR